MTIRFTKGIIDMNRVVKFSEYGGPDVLRPETDSPVDLARDNDEEIT